MSLSIHHLNCGSLCPFGGRFVDGQSGLLERARLCCHCLLVEGNDGLVLIETGLGTRDVEHPDQLGWFFRGAAQPRLLREETALHQVQRLGFKATDVRHIVVTHLHVDHAGGLPDFPDATVHVHAPEHRTAMHATIAQGYVPGHFAHDVQWRLHDERQGDRWYGFEYVEALPGTDDRVLLIPLPGHTRGHAAVAIQAAGRWLLHAGDAYMFHREMDPDNPRCTPGLRLFQAGGQADGPARHENQARLRELARDHRDEVTVFCAHDRFELDTFTRGEPRRPDPGTQANNARAD